MKQYKKIQYSKKLVEFRDVFAKMVSYLAPEDFKISLQIRS
jgi:hypothetical protein